MNILAVDTTEESLSLALKAGERVLRFEGNGGRPHDETLIPAIERLVKRGRVALGELDAIAVARGPGRFTGIRIGMAYAAVAASRLKIPAVALTRLEAAAFAAGAEKVCAAIPGWKDERSYQLFRRRGAGVQADGEAAWAAAADWGGRRAELEKAGWLVLEGRVAAVDLLGLAERLVASKRTPRFEPLYLKPAGYEAKHPPRVVR